MYNCNNKKIWLPSVVTQVYFPKFQLKCFFCLFGVPQRLDAEELGAIHRYYNPVNIYHTKDRGTSPPSCPYP